MLHALTRRAIPRALAAAGLTTLATFALTPAIATAQSGYSVALASPLAAPKRQILNGVMWRCEGESCAGAADGSRPVTACQRVVDAFGPVARFAGPKGELSADDLARCNAR